MYICVVTVDSLNLATQFKDNSIPSTRRAARSITPGGAAPEALDAFNGTIWDSSGGTKLLRHIWRCEVVE